MCADVCVEMRKRGKKKQREAADMAAESFWCRLGRAGGWVGGTWLGITLFLLTLEAVLCWALRDRAPVKQEQYSSGAANREHAHVHLLPHPSNLCLTWQIQ